jgi:hypothetical protein
MIGHNVRFLGVGAAVDSLRFLSDHLFALARLVGTWAAISTLAVLAYAIVARPAGYGLPLDTQLSVAISNARGSSLGLVAILLPTVMGNLVVGVQWSRYILLGEAPRNPVKLRAETAIYLGRTLQADLIALLAAIPGLVVAIYVGRLFVGTPPAAIAAVLIGLLAAAIGLLTAHAVLQVVLAAAAAGDDLGVQDGLALTHGHRTSITLGAGLCYVLVIIPYVLLILAFSALRGLGYAAAADLVSEFFEDAMGFAGAALIAGFGSKLLLALNPPPVESDAVAKQFE